MMTTNGNLLKKPRELQKPQEKNRHWWNIKNLSVNEQSLNLEQIYHFEYNKTSQESDLQQISSLSLQNIPTDTEALQDENQIHETLFVKNEYDILKAKQVELDQWKKEDVYTENNDEGQDFFSLRWVLK